MNAVQYEQWIRDIRNPERHFPEGVCFATIQESDGPYDNVTCLDREGVVVSIGVGEESHHQLFGDVSAPPW